MLDIESVLLSDRVSELRQSPIFYFVVDRFLPEPMYRALAESFPPKELLTAVANYGGKRDLATLHDADAFWGYCDRQTVWRDLTRIFQHPSFLDNLRGLIGPALRRIRGWQGAKRWKVSENGSRPWSLPWELPLKLDFQFSILEPQDYVAPHTDAKRKVVSFLFFMPEPGWQPAYGGATRFLQGKSPQLQHKWSRRKRNHIEVDRLPEFYSEMEPLANIEFVPNRLLVFLKSDRTFHDVPPIRCPDGLTRRSFNINLNIA